MPATPFATSAAHELAIPCGRDALLRGALTIPPRACGLVLFVHGSGSSRFSPRNRFVAGRLNENNLATLLMDLLTEEEELRDELTRALRFDIGLLTQRVVVAIDWLRAADAVSRFPIGLFGASTGAAAALVAAEQRPNNVRAVVSRGGRPDLAAASLANVVAPTLLIVGGEDTEVLALNRHALAQLRCEKELIVVPHATHLFEETGALEAVANHAAMWFQDHLAQAGRETQHGRS